MFSTQREKRSVFTKHSVQVRVWAPWGNRPASHRSVLEKSLNHSPGGSRLSAGAPGRGQEKCTGDLLRGVTGSRPPLASADTSRGAHSCWPRALMLMPGVPPGTPTHTTDQNSCVSFPHLGGPAPGPQAPRREVMGFHSHQPPLQHQEPQYLVPAEGAGANSAVSVRRARALPKHQETPEIHGGPPELTPAAASSFQGGSSPTKTQRPGLCPSEAPWPSTGPQGHCGRKDTSRQLTPSSDKHHFCSQAPSQSQAAAPPQLQGDQKMPRKGGHTAAPLPSTAAQTWSSEGERPGSLRHGGLRFHPDLLGLSSRTLRTCRLHTQPVRLLDCPPNHHPRPPHPCADSRVPPAKCF